MFIIQNYHRGRLILRMAYSGLLASAYPPPRLLDYRPTLAMLYDNKHIEAMHCRLVSDHNKRIFDIIQVLFHFMLVFEYLEDRDLVALVDTTTTEQEDPAAPFFFGSHVSDMTLYKHQVDETMAFFLLKLMKLEHVNRGQQNNIATVTTATTNARIKKMYNTLYSQAVIEFEEAFV